MRRSRTHYSVGNPLLIWADLAWKTGEMMLASAQVIGHRTGRMAAAGSTPNARDRREFALMGQEKIDAAVEAGLAMAAQMMSTHPQIGVQALMRVLTGATATMSLAPSRSAGQAAARQAKLVRTMMQSVVAAAQLSESVARVAQRGLKPIHSRATANAKRLGKG
jgi:hypothetical protein